jgi:hypothetical protein
MKIPKGKKTRKESGSRLTKESGYRFYRNESSHKNRWQKGWLQLATTSFSGIDVFINTL